MDELIVLLSIGVIVLCFVIVFLCISVANLKAKMTYYDIKVDELDKHIAKIYGEQERLCSYTRHSAERIDNLELKNWEHKLKQNKMQNKMDTLEESLKNKTEFKTKAQVFRDTYGYSVPYDMYSRYKGFWDSEYKSH